jgi:hypothetical protein
LFLAFPFVIVVDFVVFAAVVVVVVVVVDFLYALSHFSIIKRIRNVSNMHILTCRLLAFFIRQWRNFLPVIQLPVYLSTC